MRSSILILTGPRLTLAALFLTVAVASGATWERLAPLPEPNGGFIAGVADGRLIVVGGTNWEGGHKNWLKTVTAYDPASGKWLPGAALEQPVAYGVAGNYDGTWIVVGGTTGAAPSGVRLRLQQGRISAESERALPYPAVLAAGGVVGNEFIVMGGTGDAADLHSLSRRVLACPLRGGAVRTLPDFPGPATGIAASVVVAGELLVFGGASWSEGPGNVANHAEAYSLRPSGAGRWRTLRPCPVAVRGVAAVSLDGRHIYLAGGYRGDAEGFTDAGFIYDMKTDSYRPAAPLPIRAAVGLVKLGDYVYCLGGEDRMRHRTDAVFRIRVAALGE